MTGPAIETKSRRTRRWAALVVAAAGLAAIVPVFLAMRKPSKPEPSLLGTESVEVVPGVYYIAGLGPSAAYEVETSEGLVLIDSGLDPAGAVLNAETARLGLDLKRVKAVLLTHAHGDHTGGAAAVRSATGAKVYAGKEDAAIIRDAAPREAIFSTFPMTGHVPRKTPVDVELTGGETLRVGDTTFQVLAMPGHSPGSIGYLMERDGTRILFAGDVVTMLLGDGNPHPMGLRPLGTYSAFLAPRYRGDLEAYLATLRMLRSLPPPDLVLPGHPGSDPFPQNPHLGLDRWRQLLDEGIHDLELLRDRYQADGRDFLDGQPKTLLDGLAYLGDFGGGAVYALKTPRGTVLVNAPGGPGLADFVAERLAREAMGKAGPAFVLLTSADPAAVAGLKDVVDRWKPTVLAPPGGEAAVRAACPPSAEVRGVNATEDFGAEGKGPALSLRTIPLKGRDLAPAAYVFTRDGKIVLITGRIPSGIDPESAEALKAEFAGARDPAIEFLLSIQKLAKIEPDVWLPSIPHNGQNANVYDTDWTYVIENNYRLGRSLLGPYGR